MKYIVITSLLLLAACADGPKIIEKPVMIDKPELIVPNVQPVEQYGFEWTVVTKENLPALIKEFEDKGQPLVLFGLTPMGYQNLAMDMAELRRYIAQQQAIVLAYKNYYAKKDEPPKVEEPKKEEKDWWKIW